MSMRTAPIGPAAISLIDASTAPNAACADVRCGRRVDGYEAGPSRRALPLHFQAVPGLAGFQLGADPPVWTENLNCRNFVIPRRLT
jgi:hypothetical protein